MIQSGLVNRYLPIIGRLRNDLKEDKYCLVGLLNGTDVIFYQRQNREWVQIEKETIDLEDRFKRTPFPRHLMDIICNSCVVLIGVGSMGSRITMGLTRTGINHLKLVDPDIFSIENLFRHECDLTDIGRFKVEAVKERLLKINPLAKVETYPFDIFKDKKAKEEVFKGTNLVIATTDKVSVQLKVNDVCIRKNIPVLFAGCYSEARAGEILYVIPGETIICYECLRSRIQPEEKPKKYIYHDSEQEEYEGEPGLNSAINFISDVAEQYAVALLFRKEDCQMAKLINPKQNLIFISGALGKGFYWWKDTYCFSRPFEFVFPKMNGPCPDCEICQKMIPCKPKGLSE